MADILLSVGLQRGTAGSTQIEQDLTSIINRINSNPPQVNIGLNVSEAALRTFRTQLQQIINTVALTNGAPITVNISGLGELAAKANDAKAALTGMGEAARKASAAASGAAATTKAATTDAEAEAKRLAQAEHERQRLLQQSTTLLTQMQNAERNWTKSARGTTKEQYAEIQEYIRQIQVLRSQFETGAIDATTFRSRLDQLKTSFGAASSQIKNAGEATKSLIDHFVGLASKFGSWFGTTQIIMTAIRHIKQMVKNVIELDTAMTELKKVTNETDATYARFLDNATNRAAKLGATLSDVVSATADFARLGYGIDDASKLADAAIIYKNVGDDIKDITQASESIISTMQAFGIEANNVMSIVDKFNAVGNAYAISSTGVGDALMNSASALYAAGNTIDESIALITAANEVIQNPEKVGTAMKTLSMYIRAAKTEAEDAGIATNGMASSVSELRQEILALTGGQVDIMIDDTNFKSTYQIIEELAGIWGTLEETTQANITELIGGGVKNANVISALMTNFAKAEDVLTTSLNSAGSAISENEKYLESIAGKISLFKAAWQDLSNTLVNSTLVKAIVDFGTGLLSLVDNIGEFLGSFGALMASIPLTVAAFQKFTVLKSIFTGLKTSMTNFVGGAKKDAPLNTPTIPWW